MRLLRASRKAVSPVIAVVLLVAITTVLAAVVYVTVSSLIQHTEVTPLTFMTRVSQTQTQATIEITGIESAHRLIEFSAVLLINRTPDTPSTIRPLEVKTMGNLTYEDLGDDKLSIGDRFIVDTVPGAHYELIVIYLQTGNSSGSVEWET